MQDAATIVDLWRIDLEADGVNPREAEALLSNHERERTFAGPAVPRRRRTLARAALRTVLGTYTERHPQALRFAYNEHGKPRLSGIDGGCEVSFNLTTSRSCCLIAVTWGADIGVDVEHVVPLPALDRVAAGVFSPGEAARIGRLIGEAKLIEFYTCWTRLEAHLKARGLALSHRPTIPPHPFAEGWNHLTLHPSPGVIGGLAVRTGARSTMLDVRARHLAPGDWT